MVRASDDRSVSKTGSVPPRFYQGVTGQSDFQNRLVASYMVRDANMSGHYSTEALRKKIPSQIRRSLANIDQYLAPRTSKNSVAPSDSKGQHDPQMLGHTSQTGANPRYPVESLPSLHK